MSDYIADLMNEKNLRELLKVLLLEGWIDEKGMVKINTNELNLAWKEVRKFNAQQSMNLVKSLPPDIPEIEIKEIKAHNISELVVEPTKQ